MTEVIDKKIEEWNDSTNVENHICRICLSMSDLLMPIFEGEGLEQHLHEKIDKHLPVAISESDGLPQQICYHCAETIIAWNSLYTLSLRTNEKLQLLVNINTQTDTNNTDNSDDELIMSWKGKKLERKTRNSQGTLMVLEETSQKGNATKKSKRLNKINVNGMNTGKGNTVEKSKTRKVSVKIDKDAIKTEYEIDMEDVSENANAENLVSSPLDSDRTSLIKCEFCSKKFKAKKSLARHVRKFHNMEALRCDICNNLYKTRSNLDRHYLKEHLTNQVSCPVCHTSFNSKKLDCHLKSVHGVKCDLQQEDRFKCKLCDKWFKNKYVRNSHLKEVHLSKPMKCSLCDFEGVRKVLRRHKKDVHGEKRFACSLCPSAFKTQQTLKMHMTSHSDIRCYTCDICGMGFKRLNNVRDHMKCHEKKSNQCQICGNFFARKRYLAIHEKTIHNFYADGVVPEEKGFECEICGAKLKWKQNLLAHMRIHTGEKPYVCKICNKDFVCHGSLRTHMAKHSVCAINESDPQSLLPAEISPFGNFNA